MQNIYESKQKLKYIFIVTAVFITVISVLITNNLVRNLAIEEGKKINVWAESIKLMTTPQPENNSSNEGVYNDYDKLLLEIIEGNNTIPVFLINEFGKVEHSMNIDKIPEDHPDEFWQKKIKQFKQQNNPIVLPFMDTNHYVYYDDSSLLKSLRIFPYAQLGVVSIFIIVSFLALSSSKKAEQNKVWVGLSKETAHQLGTPISSLMAWVEYLKTKNTDLKFLEEIDKDVQRLKIIAERFSKIGSNPKQESMDLNYSLQQAIDYMLPRISSKVKISCHLSEKPVWVLMNESLFGWVIENLIKNAVDAMNGQGNITFSVKETAKMVKIDISDTGKGISKSKFDAIFHPGYTTKERGWGLGLSLVRRIIESYKRGKIHVVQSEINKGTTFRIELLKYERF